jgi:sortase A
MHSTNGSARPRGVHRLSTRLLLLAERAAWTLGLVCVVTFVGVRADRALGARHEVMRFATVQERGVDSAAPDLSLWDPKRIVAWRNAMRTPAPAPLAVLRIPRLHLEVPVFPGTDDLTLDRGAGHIEDTARPGTEGNSGIAGHRDGFFRSLKDIAAGDTVELVTSQGREVYRVQRTWVVSPDDVSVLDATPRRSITLVTCYPFYFVGPAPERLIVRAELISDAPDTPSRR